MKAVREQVKSILNLDACTLENLIKKLTEHMLMTWLTYSLVTSPQKYCC